MQSFSEPQEVLHALAPQMYWSHDCVWRAGHEPPLHAAANVSPPDEHDAPRHCAVGYAQPAGFTPSQLPPQAEPSLRHAARRPCGAPVTVVQTPSKPGASHAWHCPPHALLQHNPSTQLPFAHCSDAVHAPPSAIFGTHAPPLQ